MGYIRKFYSEPDPDWMLDRPYPYLNETSMTRFVEDSAASLLKIYARLQAAPAPADEDPALIFLTSAETCPYPPPLGDPPAAEPL